MLKFKIGLGLSLLALYGIAQAVPAEEENIPYLITFGTQADKSWGDDDYCQIFFFVVPKNYKRTFFIRVFDPDISGDNDEKIGDFNTLTTFSLYGGKGCISNKAARGINPVGTYNSGNLLFEKKFGNNSTYDKEWFTIGPLNPAEGEMMEEYGGRVFKIIAKGESGNDGNLYRYFLSTSANENIAVEGGNAFTFEYSFRLHDDVNQVSHIYPYIGNNVVSIKQANFDYDNDGYIKLVSKVRRGEYMGAGGEKQWVSSMHSIVEKEKNTSMDIQFIKRKDKLVERNNIVFYITNQYDEYLPFYTIPIGGVPVPESKIVRQQIKN